MDDANSEDGENAAQSLEAQATIGIDKERQYVIQRSKRVEAELFVAHQAIRSLFDILSAYLTPLLHSTAIPVPDEEVVVQMVDVMDALKKDMRKKLAAEGILRDDEVVHSSSSDTEDSDGANAPPVKRNERLQRRLDLKKKIRQMHVSEGWGEVLGSVVDLRGPDADYDPVLLCRSIVGLGCQHFNQLRAIHSRMSRVTEQLRQSRLMDPSTRMGVVMRQAAERDWGSRELSAQTAAAKVHEILTLHPVEDEDPIHKVK